MYIRWKPVRGGQSYIISVVESMWRDGRSHTREIAYVGCYTSMKHRNRQVFVDEMRERIRGMDGVPVGERERLRLKVLGYVNSVPREEIIRKIHQLAALERRKKLVDEMGDCKKKLSEVVGEYCQCVLEKEKYGEVVVVKCYVDGRIVVDGEKSILLARVIQWKERIEHKMGKGKG
jgi:hypothetical protein